MTSRPGIDTGLIVGPIFSGYSQPLAVAAKLEFDLKQIAVRKDGIALISSRMGL
jgi:hypothetical protein